jgi:hypothetical protein
MDDLVQFLRARLDEDERMAVATLWDGSGNEAGWSLIASATVGVGRDSIYVADTEVARHIARHDQARVLAEVDAKRQALAHYERIQQHTRRSDGGNDYLFAEGAVRRQIQYMALPYRDDPGYRPEWAPDQA